MAGKIRGGRSWYIGRAAGSKWRRYHHLVASGKAAGSKWHRYMALTPSELSPTPSHEVGSVDMVEIGSYCHLTEGEGRASYLQ